MASKFAQTTDEKDIMENWSCYLCNNFYAPSKEARILDCCTTNICNECLKKILGENQKCPNCQESFSKRRLADFPLDPKIEEILKFEELDNNICNQCQANQENIPKKAVMMCQDCGVICRNCYDNHNRMNIFKTHNISQIPYESLSHNLKAALSESLNCEQHRDKKLESFCKNCKEAVCEKCIVESHGECRSNICTIDDEVKEAIKALQKSLNDNVKEITRVEKMSLKAMENEKTIEEERDTDISQWRKHISDLVQKISDDVETSLQNKTKARKQFLDNLLGGLQKLKTNQNRLQHFIDGASFLHNKVGILKYAPKASECIQKYKNSVTKIEKFVQEKNDTKYEYDEFVKNIFKELKKECTNGFAPKEKKIPGNLSQCRPLNSEIAQNEENENEMFSHANVSDNKRVLPENAAVLYQVKYTRGMFPRYKYHSELVQKIIDRVQEINEDVTKSSHSTDLPHVKESFEDRENTVDPNIKIRDGTVLQSPILVYGRATGDIRKLLRPLELQESSENEQLSGGVILVAFDDPLDADFKTLFYKKFEQQMTSCSWCILVSSTSDTETQWSDLLNKFPDRKFSIIPPDPNQVWNYLTSAMELKFIEILNVRSRIMELPLSIREDVKTVLKRIEHCSVLIKHSHESNEIPKKIQDVLKRFEKAIVQYGFNFENFRVIVKNESFEEVDKALHATELYDSFAIKVVCEDDFKEKIVPYHQAQGEKLYPSIDRNEYGTLGCLAFLNKTKTVALTCRHVCHKDINAFIDNELNERIFLGTCIYTTEIASDLAIVGVEIENYFPNKKLLDSRREPANATVFNINDNLDIRGEIVHKIGATSGLTQGKIVSAEWIDNVFRRIKIIGMNDEAFGSPGDSGSVVFKESMDARNGSLEVVAILVGKSTDETIACNLLQDTLEQIKILNPDIESVTFFND